MKKLILCSLIAISTSSFAFKTCDDDWRFRQDKQEHFVGSIIMAGAFNAATDDPWKAFGASIAIGGTYELVTGCASIQDFGYDVLGSAIGAYVGYKIKGLIVAPNFVGYETSF